MTEAPSAPLTLPAALERLQREARQGVVNTGRYRCQFYDWGEGPALIFINGVGDEPRSFALAMSLLSRHFRCIAYQLPMGHEDGSRLGQYRHDHLTDDLRVLLDQLKIGSATLLGHSFGGTVALKAMQLDPARFERGVLMNGFAWRPLSRWHWWLGQFGRRLPRRYELRHLRNRVIAMRRKHYLGFDRHEPQRWEMFLELTGRSPMRSLGHWGLMVNKLDLRPLLPRIRQPVLLLCGDADPLVPHVHQEMLFAGLPNAVMFQLHRCGHLPMYTHPEAMANALLTFTGLTSGQGIVHECGSGPDAAGNCPTTGVACFGKEPGQEKVESVSASGSAPTSAPALTSA